MRVEARSFTAAATRLGVSQTLVSRRIKKLEERLGTQLINRSSRGFSLTEAGELLYAKFSAITAQINEAELSVQQIAGSDEGIARLAAPLMCAYIGIPNNKYMLRKFPRLSLEVTIVDGEIDVINGGYDAALQIGEVRESNLVIRKLMDARFCVVATSAFIEQHGAPRCLEDLRNLECLCGIRNGKRQWIFQTSNDKSPFPLEVSGRFSAAHDLVLLRACLQGMGFAQLPVPLIHNDLKAKRLVRVLEDYCYRTVPIHVVYPSRNVTDRTRLLIEMVIGYLQEQLPEVKPHADIV